MSSRSVIVAGVHEGQARQLLNLVDRVASGDLPPAGGHPPVRLCVVGNAGGRHDMQRLIIEMRLAYPSAPLIVMTEDVDYEAVVRLLGTARRNGAESRTGSTAADDGTGAGRVALEAFIGTSPAALDVKRTILAAAAGDSTVLVTGETGTGKGVVARAIHALSRRANHPFIHVDCAALSSSVIESELFGHERGAFTGAAVSRPGRFEVVGQGTIFLDEIGDIEQNLQRKLLRVLHDREFERVGGTKTIRMAGRVIAATNRDLAHDVRQQRFRSDLYFRLNVVHVHIPPLRERRQDIPAIVRTGLARLATELHLPIVPSISDDLLERLTACVWPGNVRQLLNVLERLLVCGAGTVLHDANVQDLIGDADAALDWAGHGMVPAPRTGPACDGACQFEAQYDRAQRDRLVEALRSTGGNVARASRRLGIPRSTLRYWIRQYDLDRLIPHD